MYKSIFWLLFFFLSLMVNLKPKNVKETPAERQICVRFLSYFVAFEIYLFKMVFSLIDGWFFVVAFWVGRRLIRLIASGVGWTDMASLCHNGCMQPK